MFIKQMFAELDEKMPCLRRHDGLLTLYYFLLPVPLLYPWLSLWLYLILLVVPLEESLLGCPLVVLFFVPLVVLYHWLSPWLYPWSDVPLVVQYQ